MPATPAGMVLFAHGSGSSRKSPRNQMVATRLQSSGFATLLLDLLTQREDIEDQVTRRHRFDIDLLGERLVTATTFVGSRADVGNLPLGYFGASTGAAAALVAAAQLPDQIDAVVSRGGRPDLAGAALGAVKAPTLLIVGGADTQVIELNRQAMDRLTDAETQLQVVAGAGHLFSEPGALELVADLAGSWFGRHLERS